MDWIKNDNDSTVEILKDELKEILVIMKWSKRTRKISVFFKTWSEEIPATTIYSAKKGFQQKIVDVE